MSNFSPILAIESTRLREHENPSVDEFEWMKTREHYAAFVKEVEKDEGPAWRPTTWRMRLLRDTAFLMDLEKGEGGVLAALGASCRTAADV